MNRLWDKNVGNFGFVVDSLVGFSLSVLFMRSGKSYVNRITLILGVMTVQISLALFLFHVIKMAADASFANRVFFVWGLFLLEYSFVLVKYLDRAWPRKCISQFSHQPCKEFTFFPYSYVWSQTLTLFLFILFCRLLLFFILVRCLFSDEFPVTISISVIEKLC